MKTNNSFLFASLNQHSLEALTQEAKETVALQASSQQAGFKTLSIADLWNIRRMKKNRAGIKHLM